jgi:hypothetical protein
VIKQTWWQTLLAVLYVLGSSVTYLTGFILGFVGWEVTQGCKAGYKFCGKLNEWCADHL